MATRTSASSLIFFLVAEASADSREANTMSLATFFSRAKASTSSSISLLMTFSCQSQIKT
jgi:hypothetical protein